MGVELFLVIYKELGLLHIMRYIIFIIIAYNVNIIIYYIMYIYF